MTTAPTPVFDLCGPLPEGTTVLEASAGTGKTHTIAGLTARYLAEGVARIDELMLVTFGRAATAELRERVRVRLAEVTAAMEDAAQARESADDLVRHLATGSDDEVRTRWRRLARALADFDAATITTTHGFCHQMLAGLGVAADLDHDVTFTEDTGDLVNDVATDLYVADYGRDDSPPPDDAFPFSAAADLATSAVGDPAAELQPADAVPGTEAHLRLQFAERARADVRRRKRRMRMSRTISSATGMAISAGASAQRASAPPAVPMSAIGKSRGQMSTVTPVRGTMRPPSVVGSWLRLPNAELETNAAPARAAFACAETFP
jgi:exodeoxyribonuclease V beta subunit